MHYCILVNNILIFFSHKCNFTYNKESKYFISDAETLKRIESQEKKRKKYRDQGKSLCSVLNITRVFKFFLPQVHKARVIQSVK